MSSDLRAGWNAGAEYCDFIIEMERSAFLARTKISDAIYSADVRMTSKYLDDWFEALQNIYDKVLGYMDEKTIEALNALENEKIKAITSGDYIVNCSLDSRQLKELLDFIRSYNRQISVFLARAGIYMQADIKQTFKDLDEELGKRNAGI